MQTKIKNAIPLLIASEKIKHLGINLKTSCPGFVL